MPRFRRTLSHRALVWLLIVSVMTGLLAARWQEGAPLDPSFLSILPSSTRDPLEAEAIARMTGAAEGRLLWLVRGDADDATARAAEQLVAELEACGLFARVDGLMSDDSFELDRWAELSRFRWQLLPKELREGIARSPEAFVRTARDALFGPFGSTRLAQLGTDPLGIFEAEALGFIPPGIELYQGRLTTTVHDGVRWAVLASELVEHDLDLVALENVAMLAQRMRTVATERDATLLVTGLPLFAADGAARAKREISVIGTGSTIGILLLLILTFRSPWPIVLAVVTSATGLLIATTVTSWLFPHLLLLTLVFGATLIGLSIDYALHYLCDALRGPDWRPEDGIRRTFLGLALGLAVPLLAYASLSVAPFPVLRQISVYSAAGLFGAWLTAVLLLPAVARAPRQVRRPALMRVAAHYSAHFPKFSNGAVAIAVSLVALSTVALTLHVGAEDDVRRFQSPSVALRAEADQVATILGQQRDTQFLLIRGDDETQWLMRERNVIEQLERLQHDGKLDDFIAIGSRYPSRDEQRLNVQFARITLYDSGIMDDFFNAIQATDAVRAQHRTEMPDADRTIDVDAWVRAIGEPYDTLWLGCESARGCASIVTLDGFGRLRADERAELDGLDGTSLVDRVGEISSEMTRYRIMTARLVAAAYLIAILVLCARFGALGGIRIAAVPLFAVFVALIVLQCLGIDISLFTTFALVLVVGFAFDYAVFYRLHGATSETTALAVFLSAATTLLGFGLLSLSDTAVLREFGITMTVGLSSAFLLAPISAGRLTTNEQRR